MAETRRPPRVEQVKYIELLREADGSMELTEIAEWLDIEVSKARRELSSLIAQRQVNLNATTTGLRYSLVE